MADTARWVCALGASAILMTAAAGCDGDDGAGTASAGAGGQAAAGAGPGGSAGTGGAGGGAGSACSPERAVTEDEFARAVVVLDSCRSDDGDYRTQTYLRGKVGGYAYQGGACFVACLAAVTNGCAGVNACFGLSDQQPGDQCDTCVGNVGIVCSELNVRWDCSKYGGTCNAGRCIPADRPACDESMFEDHCDAEGRPLHCDDALQVGPTCASYGLACQQEAFNARCVGTGEACAVDDYSYFDVHYVGQSCNGARLKACVRGKLAELDCGLFGPNFSCQSSAGSFFCGLAAECDPETFAKRCEGTSSVVCNAGKLTRVDCTALGFQSCSADARADCE